MKQILIFVWFIAFMQCQSQKIDKYMIPTVDKNFERITKVINESRTDEITEKTHIIYTGGKTGFSEVIYHDDSNFKSVKNYYPSRNIENKGIAFNEGSPVGTWYYFDESGKLIKEENMDEGYDFRPDNVIAYCEKNKIHLPKGYHDSGYQTRVLKQDFEGKKVWRISHQIAGDKIEEIILDGKTGQELQKKIVPFYNP